MILRLDCMGIAISNYGLPCSKKKWIDLTQPMCGVGLGYNLRPVKKSDRAWDEIFDLKPKKSHPTFFFWYYSPNLIWSKNYAKKNPVNVARPTKTGSEWKKICFIWPSPNQSRSEPWSDLGLALFCRALPPSSVFVLDLQHKFDSRYKLWLQNILRASLVRS